MKRIILALVATSAMLILIAVLLGYGGPLWLGLDMFAHFRLHLLVVIVPIAGLGLMLSAWTHLWRLLVAAGLALAGLVPIWERPSPPGEGRELVVMTANLFQLNRDTAEMIAAIKAADADILITNETPKIVQTGPDRLTDLYPFRLAVSTTRQTLRTVLWSKYPMRQGQLLLEDQIEPTGVHALVQIDRDTELAVLGLHLAHALPGNQDTQIDALSRIAEGLPPPRIVMGDFNAAPWSHALSLIEAHTATHRIPGYRVTWRGGYATPAGSLPAPIGHAIDHILISDTLGVRQIETMEIPGSDHRGVRATLTIPRLSAPDSAAPRPRPSQ